MDQQRIGVLIIGQTPRTDLMAPLERLGLVCKLLPRGALDDLDIDALPDSAGGLYPLVTRMRDGTRVTVDEAFLMPLLQSAIDELERDGVIAILLLCAGPFQSLTSTRPLLRPFQLAARTLQSLGHNQVIIVVPTNDQTIPSERKWTQAGLQPVIWSMERKPANLPLERWIEFAILENDDLSAIVFDYVGYPIDAVQRVQVQVGRPVIDLGHLAVAILETMMLDTDDR